MQVGGGGHGQLVAHRDRDWFPAPQLERGPREGAAVPPHTSVRSPGRISAAATRCVTSYRPGPTGLATSGIGSGAVKGSGSRALLRSNCPATSAPQPAMPSPAPPSIPTNARLEILMRHRAACATSTR
ncbi:hypothetical protein [Nonomuraea salmonea]|uniref:hypothetical protein n=1 Tax=Nonomuraea salmonea TaxID=46181 RepID=UPI002FEC2FFD